MSFAYVQKINLCNAQFDVWSDACIPNGGDSCLAFVSRHEWILPYGRHVPRTVPFNGYSNLKQNSFLTGRRTISMYTFRGVHVLGILDPTICLPCGATCGIWINLSRNSNRCFVELASIEMGDGLIQACAHYTGNTSVRLEVLMPCFHNM